MTWAALIAALVAFFEPFLQKWLQDLFKKVEAKLATATPSPDAIVAVHDVFAAARESMTWLDVLRGRGRVLAAFERIALTRANQIQQRAEQGAGPVLYMSGEELDSIVNGG